MAYTFGLEISERCYRAKMRSAGLMEASTSTQQGVHVVGVRGSLPRHAARDARIAELRASGLSWVRIAKLVGLRRDACRKAWMRHTARREESR